MVLVDRACVGAGAEDMIQWACRGHLLPRVSHRHQAHSLDRIQDLASVEYDFRGVIWAAERVFAGTEQ